MSNLNFQTGLFMKKFLMVIPALALLTACQSAPKQPTMPAQTNNVPSPTQIQKMMNNAHSYKCDNSAHVVAIYSDETANINITAPSLNLDKASFILKEAVSASGARYVLQATGSNTSYEWHTKGDIGLLTVQYDGKEYGFSCQKI